MKILSIPGGGVFGMAPLEALARSGVAGKFDLYAGTSIGSAVAALSALDAVNDKSVQLFRSRLPKIFERRIIDRLRPWRTPTHKDGGLNDTLRMILPGSLGEVPKPFVAVAMDMNRRQPKVFSSYGEDDKSRPLWEVCRASCAAQTYFKPWKGYGDGGPMANNPSLVAVIEALRRGVAPLEDIELLHVGTGNDSGDYSPGSTQGWSYLRWALWLIPAMLHGAGDRLHDQACKRLPLKRYVRVDFTRDARWRMNDPGVADLILEQWDAEITRASEIIKEF